ncbi:MAG: hypothetical protein ABJA35_09120 [Parafilimonas sp.]
MIIVQRTNDKIIFTVHGWNKLFAFKSSLEIPVEHIIAVYPDPAIQMNFLDSLKLLGTDLPTIFRAGTFYQHGETVFWDVRNTDNVIIVELNHEHFKKLVIEVENPAKAIEIIKGK